MAVLLHTSAESYRYSGIKTRVRQLFAGDNSTAGQHPCVRPHFHVPPRHLQKVEDDRWLQLEGASSSQWRSCPGCAFLNEAGAAVCEACGIEAPSLTKIGDASDITAIPNSLRRRSLQEVVIADILSCPENINATSSMGSIPRQLDEHIRVDHAKCFPSMESAHFDDQVSTSSEMQNDTLNEDSDIDDESDCESEYEVISGALDESPAVGTLVKVLHEDDKWWPGRVVEASGTIARIAYDEGSREKVDLAMYAVRLMDYHSDDECDNDEEQHGLSEALKPCGVIGKSGIESKKTNSSTLLQVSQKYHDDVVGDNASDAVESEYEIVPGTLDVAPPVGTMIKVLHEDQKWWPARVVLARGPTCKIMYENGASEEVDVDVFAVRLLEYPDEDEHDNAETQDRAEGIATRHVRFEPECNEIEYDEYEHMPGILDFAPHSGAHVEILHDDDSWWHARVIEPNGATAKVMYRSGDIDEVDFEANLVRRADCFHAGCDR